MLPIAFIQENQHTSKSVTTNSDGTAQTLISVWTDYGKGARYIVILRSDGKGLWTAEFQQATGEDRRRLTSLVGASAAQAMAWAKKMNLLLAV